MTPIDQMVTSKLEHLSALVFARDMDVVDELWCDLGFNLFGSQQGESAGTRDELATLLRNLFAQPYRISWDWQKTIVDQQGDLVWACADSQLVITHPDHTERKPYRLVCIFQKIDAHWHWRLFSGSEPAASPAG